MITQFISHRLAGENLKGSTVKTEIKKFFLKISGPQQRWPWLLPRAVLIPPALLVVADGGEKT